jgi:hypothetical protein
MRQPNQYIILNLRARMAEVYSNPDRIAGVYAAPRTVVSGEDLFLRVGGGRVSVGPAR